MQGVGWRAYTHQSLTVGRALPYLHVEQDDSDAEEDTKATLHPKALFRVCGVGCRVQGAEFRVQGEECRSSGIGCRV